MPSTYTLISSNVLGSSAASVTFSAIPSTYTDLVLRSSIRNDYAQQSINTYVTFNSDTSTNYSTTILQGTGSASSSGRYSNRTKLDNAQYADGSSSTSNTFANCELYIPSYTVAQNKPMSDFSVTETNATTADLFATANLWRNTAAITSITLTPVAGNLIAGSSFYLYGIKNS
jgi:hypothetical protein